MFDSERGSQDFADSTQPDFLDTARTTSNVCGLGIALKPSREGFMYVKRLVPGGPAELSGEIQVNCHNNSDG